MDAETLQMLRESLTKVLTEGTTRPLADRLEDLGWEEVLTEDAPSALRVLFEVKGETVSLGDALGPAMADVLAGALGAPELSSASVMLPASLRPDRLSARLDGERVVVSGVLLAAPLATSRVVVPVAQPDDGIRLALLPAGVEWTVGSADGTDPGLGLVRAEAALNRDEPRWFDAGESQAAWEAS